MACVWCGKQERDTLMWRNEVISLENTYFQCLWTVSHRTPRERKKNKPSELWKEQEKRKKKTPWIQCRKKHHSLQNPHNLGFILCEWVSEWVIVSVRHQHPWVSLSGTYFISSAAPYCPSLDDSSPCPPLSHSYPQGSLAQRESPSFGKRPTWMGMPTSFVTSCETQSAKLV